MGSLGGFIYCCSFTQEANSEKLEKFVDLINGKGGSRLVYGSVITQLAVGFEQ